MLCSRGTVVILYDMDERSRRLWNLRSGVHQIVHFHYYPYLKVFDRRRCIYVHNPKSAGKSVFRALGYSANLHVPAVDYLRADPRRFDAYYKFAFVRNPWDRCHSGFRHILAHRPDNFAWMCERGGVPVAEVDFRRFVLELLDPALLWSTTVLRPQHTWLCTPGGGVIVDEVFRFETLARDFETVAERIGLDPRLAHVNRGSNARDYRDVYDESMRRRVAEVYARDIELFGYEFD